VARIVGLGAITALGDGVQPLWQGALDGVVATRTPRTLSLPELPSVVVGEALDVAPQRPRALALATQAALQALEDAGWERPDALIVASTKGGIGMAQRVLEKQLPAEALIHFPLYAPAAALARSLDVRGPVVTVSVACASGTTAVGHALRWIRQGRAHRVLVVGVDALSEFIVRGFAALRALGVGGARPFDATRDGLCVGEGSAAICIQSGSGPARATIAGAGGANDANHITGPARDGRGLIGAVTAALADATVSADDIDAVSAHGTATRFNDQMEGVALSAVFGGRPVPVHSIKGAIGHTLGAAGVIEAVLCVRGLETGLWPPTAGLVEQDPEIGLDVVADEPRTIRGRMVLSCSAGFSGINSAVVLCR